MQECHYVNPDVCPVSLRRTSNNEIFGAEQPSLPNQTLPLRDQAKGEPGTQLCHGGGNLRCLEAISTPKLDLLLCCCCRDPETGKQGAGDEKYSQPPQSTMSIEAHPSSNPNSGKTSGLSPCPRSLPEPAYPDV